jgi:hypothetical protein
MNKMLFESVRNLSTKLTEEKAKYDIYVDQAKELTITAGNARKALFDAGFNPTEYGVEVAGILQKIHVDPEYYGTVICFDVKTGAAAIKTK